MRSDGRAHDGHLVSARRPDDVPAVRGLLAKAAAQPVHRRAQPGPEVRGINHPGRAAPLAELQPAARRRGGRRDEAEAGRAGEPAASWSSRSSPATWWTSWSSSSTRWSWAPAAACSWTPAPPCRRTSFPTRIDKLCAADGNSARRASAPTTTVTPGPDTPTRRRPSVRSAPPPRPGNRQLRTDQDLSHSPWAASG